MENTLSICYILTIPKELLNAIISYLRYKLILELGMTCTEFCYNNERKKLLNERIVILLSNTTNFGAYHDVFCKSFERYMREIMNTPQVTLKIENLKNCRSNDECSPTSWVMKHPSHLPDDKTCANLITLGIHFTTDAKFKPSDSFWKKFPKLKSMLLSHIEIDSKALVMFSKLPLLESLFLFDCYFWSSLCISQILESCAALKELYITRADSIRMLIDLVIPRQLEIFDLKSKGGPIILNLNHSVGLKSLSVEGDADVTIIVTCLLVSLKTVKLACSKNFKVQGNLEDLVTNVKELCIDAFGCYSVFGTLSNRTTILPSLEVPKFTFGTLSNRITILPSLEFPKYTFGTYRLNFLMIPYLEKLTIVTYTDRDKIFYAFSSINRRVIIVDHIFKQSGEHVKSQHNLNQGSIIVKYSPGKKSTKKKYTLSQWIMNNCI